MIFHFFEHFTPLLPLAQCVDKPSHWQFQGIYILCANSPVCATYGHFMPFAESEIGRASLCFF